MKLSEVVTKAGFIRLIVGPILGLIKLELIFGSDSVEHRPSCQELYQRRVMVIEAELGRLPVADTGWEVKNFVDGRVLMTKAPLGGSPLSE